MSLYAHASYQVAIKALIHKDDKILALITPDGYLDFPGGRVDESERDLPWTEALRREIAEEVGESVEVNILETLFVSKRQYSHDGTTYYIAAIFFNCDYINGDVIISDEHSNFVWLTMDEIVNFDGKFVSEDEKNQLLKIFENSKK